MIYAGVLGWVVGVGGVGFEWGVKVSRSKMSEVALDSGGRELRSAEDVRMCVAWESLRI